MSVKFIQKYNNFPAIVEVERRRLATLAESKAKQAREQMEATAPRSEINTPGYEHFADLFGAEAVDALVWVITNTKEVNGYMLWKLLEFGTARMSPRRPVGKVMDIIGPEFLEEAGRLTRP